MAEGGSSHCHGTTAGPTLPFKTDSFQSALNEKCYYATAASVKALNASSLLLAYQAEQQDEMTGSPTAGLWDELCMVTELCLRLHRSAAQASGRAIALMVTQERARGLKLSSLSQREKTTTPQHSGELEGFIRSHCGCHACKNAVRRKREKAKR